MQRRINSEGHSQSRKNYILLASGVSVYALAFFSGGGYFEHML